MKEQVLKELAAHISEKDEATIFNALSSLFDLEGVEASSSDNNKLSRAVSEQLLGERYKHISDHIVGLTTSAHGLFRLLGTLVVSLLTLQIAAFGAKNSKSFQLEETTIFIINYGVFFLQGLMIFFFSMQILFILIQWHKFRWLQKSIADKANWGSVKAISPPTRYNWIYEGIFILMFLGFLFFSGLLVEASSTYIDKKGKDGSRAVLLMRGHCVEMDKQRRIMPVWCVQQGDSFTGLDVNNDDFKEDLQGYVLKVTVGIKGWYWLTYVGALASSIVLISIICVAVAPHSFKKTYNT